MNHSLFYKKYLQTPEWKARRQHIISLQKSCRGCSSSSFLHVHHKTYVRLGKELDSDLVLVCEKCHEKIHSFYEKNKGRYSLWESTHLALQQVKEKLPPPKTTLLPPEGKKLRKLSKWQKKQNKRMKFAVLIQKKELASNLLRRRNQA